MARVKLTRWVCLKCHYTWPADNGPQMCAACGHLYCKGTSADGRE